VSAHQKQVLAAAASTGNNSHAAVGHSPAADQMAIEFVVEVAGGTPTVSYKLQGTFVDSPASTDWFDLIALPSDNDTAAVTRVVTAVGRYCSYVAQSHVRFAKYVRLVTSSNTNITYSANLWQHPKQ
jgi:hypothetical protein